MERRWNNLTGVFDEVEERTDAVRLERAAPRVIVRPCGHTVMLPFTTNSEAEAAIVEIYQARPCVACRRRGARVPA